MPLGKMLILLGVVRGGCNDDLRSEDPVPGAPSGRYRGQAGGVYVLLPDRDLHRTECRGKCDSVSDFAAMRSNSGEPFPWVPFEVEAIGF